MSTKKVLPRKHAPQLRRKNPDWIIHTDKSRDWSCKPAKFQRPGNLVTRHLSLRGSEVPSHEFMGEKSTCHPQRATEYQTMHREHCSMMNYRPYDED